MNNFVMFEVMLYRNQNNGVLVRCSDPGTIFKVFKKLQKLIPSATLEQPFPDGDKPNICYFRRLNSMDNQVPWMIVTMLCNQGWEPFAASATDSSDRYYLRTQQTSKDERA